VKHEEELAIDMQKHNSVPKTNSSKSESCDTAHMLMVFGQSQQHNDARLFSP
jgi:hypothetical protein